MSFEKAKQTLESENTELQAELKQMTAARQEADRKRKQAEQQLAELSVRLTEIEKGRGDLGEKTVKLQVRLEAKQQLGMGFRYFL